MNSKILSLAIRVDLASLIAVFYYKPKYGEEHDLASGQFNSIGKRKL